MPLMALSNYQIAVLQDGKNDIIFPNLAQYVNILVTEDMHSGPSCFLLRKAWAATSSVVVAQV